MLCDDYGLRFMKRSLFMSSGGCAPQPRSGHSQIRSCVGCSSVVFHCRGWELGQLQGGFARYSRDFKNYVRHARVMALQPCSRQVAQSRRRSQNQRPSSVGDWRCQLPTCKAFLQEPSQTCHVRARIYCHGGETKDAFHRRRLARPPSENGLCLKQYKIRSIRLLASCA